MEKPVEVGDVFWVSSGGFIVLLHLDRNCMIYTYRGKIERWISYESDEKFEEWRAIDKWTIHGHRRIS